MTYNRTPVQSRIADPNSKIVIVGAGPAGSSLAIRLAQKGLDVTIVEKDRFPREKLCGEFISPECLRHFESIGVKGELLTVGGDRIFETRFFDKRGRSVAVPTEWFGHGRFALSLSRAVMDHRLLAAARTSGVNVIEGSRVTGTRNEGGRMLSIDLRSDAGEKGQIIGDLFVDATGRTAVLSKGETPTERPKLVAFKAHLSNVRTEPGVCEIYFFDGGYGGLSHVEDDKANFCFIVKAGVAKRFIGQTNQLFRSILDENTRAGVRMSAAQPLHDWLAVAIDRFGYRKPHPAVNVVAVGDAGAFIDPFTGSGMLMAMDSAELLSHFIASGEFQRDEYLAAHRRLFRTRLATSSALRQAAFVPGLASAAIRLAGLNDRVRSILARATRSGSEPV